MKKLMLTVIITIFNFQLSYAGNDNIEKVRNAIVSINTRISISAYNDPGVWSGTGFIVDKAQGLIVTNGHVTGRADVGNYFITFENGRSSEAKLIYYDIWQDYAFLKVKSDEIPVEATEIKFTNVKPKLNQKVFIIGNNEGREFSFHDGYISSLYQIEGEMSQGSYIVNLNSQGGSSGSPVINEAGEAIGVIYAASKSYAVALHGEYIKPVLSQIQKDLIPARKHIGVITSLYSLDKATKHQSFSKDLMQEYMKNFPDARNKVIVVNRIISGTPAENILKPGDIIWEVENKRIGADLRLFDQLMDNTSKNTITLTIFRYGAKMEKEIPLYDINKNKVDKMIEFAGGLFFESDEIFSSKTGIPLHALSVKNIQTGSSLSEIPVSYIHSYKNVYRLEVHGFNLIELNNLEDLEKNMSQILALKFLNIRYKNYQPYWLTFAVPNIELASSQEELQTDIELDSIEFSPRILKIDVKNHEWISEDIKIDRD